MELFPALPDELRIFIDQIQPDNLTPRQALELLYDLKTKVK